MAGLELQNSEWLQMRVKSEAQSAATAGQLPRLERLAFLRVLVGCAAGPLVQLHLAVLPPWLSSVG